MGTDMWLSHNKKSTSLSPGDLPSYVTYAGNGFSFAFPQYLQPGRHNISSDQQSPDLYRYKHTTKESSPVEFSIDVERFNIKDKSIEANDHPVQIWKQLDDVPISDSGRASGFASDAVAFPEQDGSSCQLRYEYTWPRARHVYRITFVVTQIVDPILEKKVTDCHIYTLKEHALYIKIMSEILKSLQAAQ